MSTMDKRAFKAFAPATISNLGSGFDLLGLAVKGLGDHVIARFSDTHGDITSTISGHKSGIDKTDNTAIVAVRSLLSSLNRNEGIHLDIQKGYPHSSGLGSSAASAVAAVTAVNHLLGKPYKESLDLFPFAYDGEKSMDPHLPSDNVSASLLGGLVLSHFDDTPLRLPLPTGLGVVLIRQPKPIATSEGRGVLSPTVALSGHVHQSHNIASLMIGLYRSDLDLISRGLSDLIIEPQRSSLIDAFDSIQSHALAHGALGCSISGSGPTIFAIFPNTHAATIFSETIMPVYPEYFILNTTVDMEGAYIC